MSPQLSVWTIGHSTLAIEDFLHRLEGCEIQALTDVRSYPGSRRYPQFNKENLHSSLAAAGIDYLHLPELGGRRRARPDSINMSWRNESFRGYADYMETAGFELGISKLLDIAATRRTAIMCAESLWWRCHRSLISDYLKVKGIEVTHILAGGKLSHIRTLPQRELWAVNFPIAECFRVEWHRLQSASQGQRVCLALPQNSPLA